MSLHPFHGLSSGFCWFCFLIDNSSLPLYPSEPLFILGSLYEILSHVTPVSFSSCHCVFYSHHWTCCFFMQMPTLPILPTALQSTPFTYFAFCLSFLLFNDFPTDKLCSKCWEARSTYSTVHWAHCSLSVPEQMEAGLQSCSSQDSSVTMCESHGILSAFWLTNLCASHFYFLFFFF